MRVLVLLGIVLSAFNLRTAVTSLTPLLDVLLSRGHNAPYSCREGACSACVCKLIEGDVDMVQNNILVDDDIEDGERLACQALPLTDAVTVSFDDL